MTKLASSPVPGSTGNRGSAFLAVLVVAVLGIATLGLASSASASDDEVRVSGSCGAGATSGLRLRADDGSIRVRFRVESNRRRSSWQVVIVREGRVVWRGRAGADGGGSLEVRLRIRDLAGADQITARAVGPRGITCIAAGTLPA